jgi:hypothetical protein
MDEKELLAIKDTLFKEKWVVSIYDSKVKRSEIKPTLMGSRYVTVLLSLVDYDELKGLNNQIIHVSPPLLKDLTSMLEKQGLLQQYWDGQDMMSGISEEGYKRLYVIDWLLDKELQKKYRRKIAVIDGFDKGMKMVLQIMTGVVKFGQSMAPPAPKKNATPKKKAKPKRKTYTKRKPTPRQKTNAQHSQWSKDMRSFYEL